MTRLDELGLTNNVSIDPRLKRLIKKTAMKTVTSIADLPQNSKQNPIRNMNIPKRILLFINTFQMLDI